MKQSNPLPDIPTLPILEYLKENGGIGCSWFEPSERRVTKAIPDGIPVKVVLAKMRVLIRNGLVDGCGCGCRGDFELTEKGEQAMNEGLQKATARAQ